MSRPQRSEALLVDGTAGRLEAILELPGCSTPRAAAVICHPHPMHGGTMQNKVAHTLSRAFTGQEITALRFNFRGVGKSDGEFDEGDGELEDVLSAINFVRDRCPGSPVWLAGFSFGAAMAIRAAIRTNVAGLISVAPAAFRFAEIETPQPTCPWLIVHGENDELVDINDTIDWVNSMAPGPELCVFPETTHFFHGKLIELRNVVMSFLDKY